MNSKTQRLIHMWIVFGFSTPIYCVIHGFLCKTFANLSITSLLSLPVNPYPNRSVLYHLLSRLRILSISRL